MKIRNKKVLREIAVRAYKANWKRNHDFFYHYYDFYDYYNSDNWDKLPENNFYTKCTDERYEL